MQPREERVPEVADLPHEIEGDGKDQQDRPPCARAGESALVIPALGFGPGPNGHRQHEQTSSEKLERERTEERPAYQRVEEIARAVVTGWRS